MKMRYNLYRFVKILFKTLILYLLLGELLKALILSITIEILANLSISKRILGLTSSLVKLEKSERSYLEDIKKDIDKELTDRGIRKIDYSLAVTDEGEMIIYSLGDNKIYLDSSFLKISRSKLKAAIYHELGHIYHGDIAYLSSIILDNLIFLLLIEIILVKQAYFLLAILMPVIIYIWININLFLFNKNNYEKERKADRFAIFMGYGGDLLKLLLEYKYSHDKTKSNIASTPSRKYLKLKKRILEIEKNEA